MSTLECFPRKHASPENYAQQYLYISGNNPQNLNMHVLRL